MGGKSARTVGVIPARFDATRFPGKPLAVIGGQYLVERVWRQAKKAKLLDEVLVATDDERVASAAASFGATAVMTPKSCRSGTDRIADVARNVEKKADIFINIQGDEPLISPRLIDALARSLQSDPGIPMVTAVYPLKEKGDIAAPNVVKAVLDEKGYALYFSRCPVPYPRSKDAAAHYKHLGIYGYRRDFLLAFNGWRQTPLEKAEGLEQLRALEKGFRIKAVISRHDSAGVDVPGDVRKIERLLQ